MRIHRLPGFLALASIVASAPAHALIQTVSPIGGGGFSTNGANLNQTDIQFPGFSASTPDNLLGVRVKLNNASFTGRYSVSYVDENQNPLPPTTVNVSTFGVPKFTFTSTIGSTSGDSQALLPNPAVVNCPLPSTDFVCSGVVNLSPASQSYTGAFAQLATATPALKNYFIGIPTIDISQSLYSKSQSPGFPDLGLSVGNLNFSGDIVLEYEYVPGPLPLLGAGAAFGWSRRLRKRISKSKSSST